jgi:hypothetical protein
MTGQAGRCCCPEADWVWIVSCRAISSWSARLKDDSDLNQDTLDRRRVLGDDHPDTLTSASNLALDLGALREARDGLRGRRWLPRVFRRRP